MGTATNADSTSNAGSNSDSSSIADRLATAAKVIWVAFLALVVVFTLIPVVGLLLGAVPFASPPATPYFTFVGLTLVGTVALVGGAIVDV